MIYGILLTAGMSARMGQPKQLLDWHGQPLVRHVVQQALVSNLAGLVVVTGFAAAATQASLASAEADNPVIPLYICFNPAYREGQATSLRAGLAELPADAQAVLVLLVDQPLVTPALMNQMLAAFQAQPSGATVAVVPTYRGQQGNPVLLSRALFAELRDLSGDEGARGVLRRHAQRVHWLPVDDPAVVMDADTPEQYQALHEQG